MKKQATKKLNSKSTIKSPGKQVYEDVMHELDAAVASLSPAEFLEFLDLMISDLKGREETAKQELEDAEN